MQISNARVLCVCCCVRYVCVSCNCCQANRLSHLSGHLFIYTLPAYLVNHFTICHLSVCMSNSTSVRVAQCLNIHMYICIYIGTRLRPSHSLPGVSCNRLLCINIDDLRLRSAPSTRFVVASNLQKQTHTYTYAHSWSTYLQQIQFIWATCVRLLVPAAVGITHTTEAIVITSIAHRQIDLLDAMICGNIERFTCLTDAHHLYRFVRCHIEDVKQFR